MVLKAVPIAYSTASDSVLAAGIVFHTGSRVFMAQRPDGTWAFPGGHIEDGESAEMAARRETIEEIGYVHVGDLQSVGVFDDSFHVFAACVEPFEARLNDEHIGCGWFRLEELPSPLHGCASNALACIFNAIGSDASDTAKTYDINGFFEVMDNPLSKVGVFNYLGRNIPQEKAKGNADKFFAVYRPAEELNNPDCIYSFRLSPWIIDHAMIGDGTNGTIQIEEKGARGVTGEQIWFDPNDDYGTLKGNIKCFSAFLAESIAAGKTPLSLGYRCVYEYKPGVFEGKPYTYVQRHIRGNHLASVDDGRMGPEVVVMDGFSIKDTEKSLMSKKQRDALLNAKSKTIAGVVRNRLMAFALDAEEKVAEGKDETGELKDAIAAIEAVAPLLEAVEELRAVGESDILSAGDTAQMPGDIRKKEANGQDDEDDEDEGKGMDAKEIARVVDAAIKKAVAGLSAGMDSREVVRVLADRDSLVKQVGRHIADFEHVANAMDAQEVAEYAVSKLEIPADKGVEVVALKAWLHGRQPAHAGQVAHAGDAAERIKKPSFLSAQLAERS